MECELCGRNVKKTFPVKIEGAVLHVCRECAGHGVAVKQKGEKKKGAEDVDLTYEFWRIVREARKRKGITVEELGRAVGLSGRIIKKLERGEYIPPKKVAERLEEILNINIIEEEEKKSVFHKFELRLGDVVKIK